MPRQNAAATRTKPAYREPIGLQVLRREAITPGFSRVTLGGGDVQHFQPLGYDQWFRLFVPVDDQSLQHVPRELTTVSYLKMLTVSKRHRPLARNYTVAAYRPDGVDGPELDVDFALHGSTEESAGPVTNWARSCTPGDQVVILDEGTTFALPQGCADLCLVADETALPAVGGILASVPRDVRGRAIIEVSSEADRRPLDSPTAVEVTWAVRPPDVPRGRAALEAVREVQEPCGYGWVAGEQALVSGTRRHWVAQGVPKERITFCGYWRHRAGRR